jgi:hypothetical protein
MDFSSEVADVVMRGRLAKVSVYTMVETLERELQNIRTNFAMTAAVDQRVP